jgi:hypothetical protein
MPFWLANLCDRLIECWLNAAPSGYCAVIILVIGLGVVGSRCRI